MDPTWIRRLWLRPTVAQGKKTLSVPKQKAIRAFSTMAVWGSPSMFFWFFGGGDPVIRCLPKSVSEPSCFRCAFRCFVAARVGSVHRCATGIQRPLPLRGFSRARGKRSWV